MGGRRKGGVRVSKRVKTSFMPALDLLPRLWVPASLFCSIKSTGRLLQELCLVMQDPGAIIIEGLKVFLSNELADSLSMELLKL